MVGPEGTGEGEVVGENGLFDVGFRLLVLVSWLIRVRTVVPFREGSLPRCTDTGAIADLLMSLVLNGLSVGVVQFHFRHLVSSGLRSKSHRMGPIYLLFMQLGARSYSGYRKEISINESSKTDMRKLARKSDKGNPPPAGPPPAPIHQCLFIQKLGCKLW